MIKRITKRVLSLLLCLTMLVGMVPMSVFADSALTQSAESTQTDDSAALKAVKDRMDAILVEYLGTTEMDQESVESVVWEMSDLSLTSAWEDSSALKQDVLALTDPEFYSLSIYESTETFGYFYGELEEIFEGEISLFAVNTLSLLDGAITVTDSIGNGTLSSDTVTIKAVGSTFSKKTNTITVANESGSKASVSFDYSVSNANSFSIAGTSDAASGTYSVVLEAGATLTISLQSKSGLGNKTAILTMSNFSLAAAAESSVVTVEFDSSLGSVTAADAAISSGVALEATLADGIALVATANSGVRFLGWVDASTNLVLSTSASYTLNPTADVTVEALFAGAGSVPYFGMGAKTQGSASTGLLGISKLYYYTVVVTHIYDDLNEAATVAGQSGKTLVLLNDGTLGAGSYTIPANVTLLIPFSLDNRMYTTQVENVSAASYTTPTAYRTLTLADGANITVNGAISVSAKQTHAEGAKFGGGGVPTGAAGFIRMQGTSSITVNNGGALYVYGFITGSGSVVANSGATVYECFQLMDFRGGTQSTRMKNGVFPMSQYYIQNIEVPMTLYAGASEYSYTTIYMSSADFGSSVKFISSSGAMFNLSSGYVVKEYDGSTDRLIVRSYGDLNVSPITMEVGTSDINSADYDLPISSSLTVDAVSGSISIMQDVAFLPGSRIKIGEGVTCTLGSGNSVYVYDSQVWDNFAFAASLDYKLIPASYAASRTYTRTEADLVDAEVIINGTVNATAGYLYSTAGGANIYSEGNGVIISKAGTQTVTHQYKQVSAAYVEIPLQAGVLKNADSTTLSMTSPNGTYSYVDGVWTVDCEHVYSSLQTKAPTCTEKGVITYTCPCGSSYTEAIDALGHTWGAEPTCTTAQICTVCGAEKAPATGHNHTVAVTKQPTCTEEGVKTYTCACGDSFTEAISALGHSHTSSMTTAPGCESEGVMTYTCACGDSYTEAIAATGHSFTTTVVEAGEYTLGTSTVTCSGCDYIEVTYTDAKNGLIIYVDTAAEIAGNGTAEAPFNSYAAAFEYADGQFDATVILLSSVSFNGAFVEPAHTGAFTVRAAADGGFAFASGASYTASGVLVLSNMNITADGAVSIGAAKLTVDYGVEIDGEVSLNAADITICSGSYTNVDGTDITVKGGSIAGAVNATGTLRVTNGFDYKSSFTLEGAGFFGNESAVIYAYSAFASFEEGKGDVDSFTAAYDMRPDIDGDGEIANDDITVIVRQLSGYDMGYNEVNYDVNSDGKINNRDVIIVIRAIAFAASAANAQSVSAQDVEVSVCVSEGSIPVYRSVAAPGEGEIVDYEEFLFNLMFLEEIAVEYTNAYPGKDPIALVIKYIRTGVDRYNSGSWGIMAGYEDAEFAAFVAECEEMINAEAEEMGEELRLNCTGLKNIHKFYLPNGDYVDFGHMFGSMDITYHNKGSVNHADVSGWAGDLVDLLELSDKMGVSGSLDEMMADIAKNYFAKQPGGSNPGFSLEDVYGDLDAFYVIETLYDTEYYTGAIAEIIMAYCTDELTDEARAEYFLKNRLGTTGTRAQVRSAVYNEYTSNKLISTLEGTRDFNTGDISALRRAVCYVFGDYLCKLAGDYVEVDSNSYYEVFSTDSSTLAPGVTQDIKYATTNDGKQMVYYIATADITRDDVTVYANYNKNDPTSWAMSRVLDQANAAQEKYGNPDSKYYIPNYKVVASINGDGYNMATGEPGGLLVMNGQEYHPINSNGFFGITKDGVAVIGTTAEYNSTYKGILRDGIGAFGTTLVKDGEIAVTRNDNYYTSRASRTSVGITATGKVVFMVLDGRQEPVSCGGSMEEIAQIMFEAGCVHAVNLDGGGSTTFVSRPEGEEELRVINNPSDGSPRSVSTSLMIVSTAPSSTAFDHAKLESDFDYSTIGTEVKITPTGVSATGNVAPLPEGYTWAVSDSRWGKINEDGVFTGLRMGDVEVYLMLGDEIIGRKTMTVASPTNVYFTKDPISAVYGSSVELPVAAIFEGKRVAINANDVTLILGNENAGTIDGFTFTATENTGLKNAKITVSITVGDEVFSDTLTVNLFRQGENTFDFDKATGGDRQLAFDRVVSNSITEDNITYIAKDTNEKMETSYIFAMDMTTIPIPEQLSDLVYMLPGADMENATAWNFLLQLAERVSTLTEVTPVLRFDPRFDVDYSELNVMTDYFTLEQKIFDAETNTLTLKLRWIDQTKAIDPATANSLCLVSGIKLTPKADADWGAKNTIKALHSGEISYNIFLRASNLYSFAQKPENQEQYGLLPFVNPDIPSESGASFGSVYKSFEDTYTLVNALKSGWYNENGGFAYYVQGTKYYNVREVDGYYYDFGDNGINAGQEKYTGLFRDDENGVYRYAKNGELCTGWHQINGDWHYFDPSTEAAVTGTYKIDGINYNFTVTGKVVTGKWIHTLKGVRYYYGPTFHKANWQCIDGDWYYFRNGYRVTGVSEVYSREVSFLREWHDFGEDGKDRGFIPDGVVEKDGELFYVVNGLQQLGLTKVGDDYYFFNYEGVIKNKRYYAWRTNCDLPMANYDFDEEGKLRHGFEEIDGTLYYYVNGNPADCGMIEIDGDYYYIYWGGVVKTGEQYVVRTKCDLPASTYYEFGEDGKMLQGIVEKDGTLYYYENGKLADCGMIKVDGDYYYVYWGGVIKTGKQYVVRTKCDLPVGNYEFDEDGKMTWGIVEQNGTLYYYEGGRLADCGMIEIDGDYYYVYWGGVIKTGKQYVVRTKCDLPASTNYEFGEDGKMLQGIVKRDGTLYYYVNGKLADCGMIEIDGDYYYVYWGGVIKTGKQYVSRTNCDLPVGNYEFGEDGKMLQGFVSKNGALYYYVNGRVIPRGLTKIDGDYYYVNANGDMATGKVYAGVTNCDLPVGNYEFGEDGKMLQGIVNKDGVLYYYVDGKLADCGLTLIDGDYYYVYWGGVIKTGKQYVSRTNCDLPVGNYVFGEDGKMLRGFVEIDGEWYYFTNGRPDFRGLVLIDGYFYYVYYGGKLITNQRFYVGVTNDLMIQTSYTFDEYGRIIG